MASRIGVMSQGQIMQVGKPGDIYETPSCKFVADFIGSVNLFPGKVLVDQHDHVIIETAECKHYVSHGITGTQDMAVHVAIRPEKISIKKSAPIVEDFGSPAEFGFNTAQGVIRGLSYLGSQTIFHVTLAHGLQVKVTQANSGRFAEEKLSVADKVHVWWWGEDVVVLTQ